MKITIEPTENALPGMTPPTVTVNNPSDDLSIHEALQLIRSALLAWGYTPNTINQYIEEP